jgi:hypothetical protein
MKNTQKFGQGGGGVIVGFLLRKHMYYYYYYYYYLQLRTAAFKAYCAVWVRHSNFHHQASPRVSPRESTQQRKVELWVRNVQ